MNIFKSFGLKKAPKGANRQPYPRIDRDTIMEGWGSEGMSTEDRREMEGRDESYGEWVNRKIEEGAKKQEDDWKKKFAEEGHTMPERFKNRPIDAVLDDDFWIDEDKRWADKIALEKPELGEGVPVKGRGLPKKFSSDKPRPSAEGDIPGRTDFKDKPLVGQSKRPKAETLADKRRGGGAVAMMDKAFGLKKNKDDADEDKKNTPNGHAPEDGDNGD